MFVFEKITIQIFQYMFDAVKKIIYIYIYSANNLYHISGLFVKFLH